MGERGKVEGEGGERGVEGREKGERGGKDKEKVQGEGVRGGYEEVGRGVRSEGEE